MLTMRSDFIGDCGQFEGLAEMVNRGEFLIPRLTREQYKRIIEGPIKVAGGQITPRLLQRLLNDLGQQADQLPCLQHALMRTWTVWSERGDSKALDLDDYQRVGRMSEALSLHADEVYTSLTDDRQRNLCRGIFQALTIQESENRGIRRPQRLSNLSQILAVPANELRPIIDAYRHQGVTFLTPSPEVELTDRTIIDISHESLMRVWARLRRWVEEEAQAAGIYRRLSESAALYAQRKAGLYRDPELGIALAWREEKRPNLAWAERYHVGFSGTMEFLEASRQASLAEEQVRANWHASRQEWPQAVEAFDRLKQLSPQTPADWLRTPGLMRLATALLYQGRAADAAGLLSGGAKRRTEDGLPPAVERAGLGLAFSYADGAIRVTELLAGYPGTHGGLRVEDMVVKIDDVDVTSETIPKFVTGFTGEAGTKVRLTVQHAGSEETEVVELARLEHIRDAATSALLVPLRTAVNERLAQTPLDAGLLELRAELAGQWQGFAAQVADYSAAIEALSKQPAETAAPDLPRLYRRRGDAYVGLKNWNSAIEDYAKADLGAAADDESLRGQALAQAESQLGIDALSPTSEQTGTEWRYTTDEPAADWNQAGFDDSKWQSGPGAFGPAGTLMVPAAIDVAAVRLEALTHPSLPGNGPGRGSNLPGTFAQISWKVTAMPPDGKEAVELEFDGALADRQLDSFPITAGGHWNIGGHQGQNCTACWLLSKPVFLAAGTTLSIEMQCHNNSDAGENLGRFRLSLSGDNRAFEHESRRLAALKLTSPLARMVAAHHLLGQEDEVERLLARRPETVVAVGEEFARNGDWQLAVAYFSRAIHPETKDADLIASRAEAYGKLGQWEPAKADWQRAFDLQPDDASLRERYLASLAAGQQWGDVAREFSRQLDAMPEWRASHTPRGRLVRAIIRRGDPAFERLMALRPQDPLLRIDLARNFVVRSDWESAIREYAKAIETIPPEEEGYEYAAALLVAEKRKDYDRFMEQFVKRAGATADPYLAYALARAAAVSPTPVAPPEKLTEWAELAISGQRRPWYLHAAGLAYLRAGNRDVALKYLQESAATTWHTELNQLAIALYYAQGQDIPQARGYLKQAEDWFQSLKAQDGYYPVQDTDWLEAHLLLREAKALIDRDAPSDRVPALTPMPNPE